MKARIKSGSPIWDSGVWPNIEYGDINIVFEVKVFGNPEYALCSAPNFGLKPYGNGPLYVKKKYLEEIEEPGALSDLMNIFGLE